MPWSPGSGTPLVSRPESAKLGAIRPGVVEGWPIPGICQAGRRRATALLVRVKLVELLPRTSTYHTPLVRNGGAITAALGVAGTPVVNASLGNRSFLTRMVANPDNWDTSSSQPKTGWPCTLSGTTTL